MNAQGEGQSAPEKPLSTKAGQILRGAAAVFMEQGYGAASMDTIARAAGVSKATVYAHYAGKDDLFAAIISEKCRQFSQGFREPELDRQGFEEALRRIGHDFLEFVLSEDALAIHRVVVAEAPRFPELGQIFYESGPRLVIGRLADFLAAATARGKIQVEEPRQAAEQYLGLIKGELHLRRLLNIGGAVKPADIERVVEAAGDMFVRAYAVGRQ